MRSVYIMIIACMLVASSVPKVFAQHLFRGKTVVSGEWRGQIIEYVADELIVVLNEGSQRKDVDDLFAKYHAVLLHTIDEIGVLRIGLQNGTDAIALAKMLVHDPHILEVHPSEVLHCHSDFDEVSDEKYLAGFQWALKNIGQTPPNGTNDADIDAAEAWSYTMGSASDTIAVLDSGIPLQNGVLSHPDLADPDRFILGPDLIEENDPEGIRDLEGHGTHVTGIIAATTDNGEGIAGVAGNVKILAIQTTDSHGLTDPATICEGIVYAVNHHAKIINISAGGELDDSGYHRAIEKALNNGVLVVISAGNGSKNGIQYPARYAATYQNVISVGATDANDMWTFSCYGPQLVVAAPGGTLRWTPMFGQ